MPGHLQRFRFHLPKVSPGHRLYLMASLIILMCHHHWEHAHTHTHAHICEPSRQALNVFESQGFHLQNKGCDFLLDKVLRRLNMVHIWRNFVKYISLNLKYFIIIINNSRLFVDLLAPAHSLFYCYFSAHLSKWVRTLCLSALCACGGVHVHVCVIFRDKTEVSMN